MASPEVDELLLILLEIKDKIGKWNLKTKLPVKPIKVLCIQPLKTSLKLPDDSIILKVAMTITNNPSQSRNSRAFMM